LTQLKKINVYENHKQECLTYPKLFTQKKLIQNYKHQKHFE